MTHDASVRLMPPDQACAESVIANHGCGRNLAFLAEIDGGYPNGGVAIAGDDLGLTVAGSERFADRVRDCRQTERDLEPQWRNFVYRVRRDHGQRVTHAGGEVWLQYWFSRGLLAGSSFVGITHALGWPVEMATDIYHTACDAWDKFRVSHARYVRTYAISAGEIATTEFNLPIAEQSWLLEPGEAAVTGLLKVWDPSGYVDSNGRVLAGVGIAPACVDTAPSSPPSTPSATPPVAATQTGAS